MHHMLSQDYVRAVEVERLAAAARRRQARQTGTSNSNHRKRTMRTLALCFASVVAGLGTADAKAASTPDFADWTAASSITDTASGTLRGIPVRLSGTDVHTGILDGTFTGFAASDFSPALSNTDTIALGSQNPGNQYRITFDAPVKDPVLQLASVASELTFNGPVQKLSGTVTVNGTTVSGAAKGSGQNSDTNGTVKLNGTYTTITITAKPHYTAPNGDGFYLQIGTLFSV